MKSSHQKSPRHVGMPGASERNSSDSSISHFPTGYRRIESGTPENPADLFLERETLIVMVSDLLAIASRHRLDPVERKHVLAVRKAMGV